jgi:hypothetical protein
LARQTWQRIDVVGSIWVGIADGRKIYIVDRDCQERLGDYLIGRGEHVRIGLAAWARAMLTFPGRRTAGLRED